MRAARGDADAFRTIWLIHRDSVYRFARWMTNDAATAEDVAQECFLCLLKYPARFQPSRGSLLSFLLGIARNQCRLRWHDLEREIPEQIEEPPQLGALLAAEASGLVAAAVSNLPPLQREALYLFEYEELSLAEAAAIAGCDVGTFKARLHRARQRLKRELAWLGLSNGTRS